MARSKKEREPIPEHFKSLEEAAEFWDSHDLADYWDLCARWWEERLAEMEQAPGLDAILQQRTIDDTCTWKDQYIERAEQLRRYMRLSDE